MGKYGDFLYLEDTYGQRVRDEVPIRITDVGYDINGAGDPVANVLVEVGPVTWDTDKPTGFTKGSRIAVMRSYSYYPPNPDRFLQEKTYNPTTDTTEFLYYDNGSMIVDGTFESGESMIFRSGQEPLGTIRPNSTLYISVYVSEQFKDSHNQTVWLPWDLRGTAHQVIPGNFGGQDAGAHALPRGVMTGGMVYAELIDNPILVLMRALGYVLDTVVTDGEMITDIPERLHPNIVVPLLRGMGMSAEEEGLFTHRTVQHRLKNLLYRYRGISIGKGTAYALQRYVEAATGMESAVAVPLNLLLDRSDTCPDNPHLGAPSNTNDQFSVRADSVSQWKAVPSVGYATGYAGGETPVRAPLGPLLADGVTQDPWWDQKNEDEKLNIAANVGAGDRLNPGAYTWVHKIWPTNRATFGTKMTDGAWDVRWMAIAEAGNFYHLRFRAYPELAADIQGCLVFFDGTGKELRRYDSPQATEQPGDWRDYSGQLVLAPPDTAYLAWEIRVTSVGAVSLGAIQVSEGNVPEKYRDPRSLAVVLNTGEPPVVDSWVTMDSPLVAMDDGNVKMDDGRATSDDTSVDSFERILIHTLRATLDRYLLPGVGVSVITSDDVEYGRYMIMDKA